MPDKIGGVEKSAWRKSARQQNPLATTTPCIDERRLPLSQEREKENEKIPDDLWVQCDFPKCLKWRRLPAGTDPSTLPDIWFCYMHPDTEISKMSHDYPEEQYDGGEENLKEAKKRFDLANKVGIPLVHSPPDLVPQWPLRRLSSPCPVSCKTILRPIPSRCCIQHPPHMARTASRPFLLSASSHQSTIFSLCAWSE